MGLFDAEELKEIYNEFASGYDLGRSSFDNSEQLDMLAQRLSGSSDVLDVGCGSGCPVLKFFADEEHRITGTDISPAMLALAGKHVPTARLLEVDSAALDFEPESFDLITSFYSLFHLDMTAQEKAFSAFCRILRPGGAAYFTLASEAYTGMPEFCGTKIFADVELPYSHITPASYRELLEQTGFIVEQMDHLLIGGETMLWVLAYKRKDGGG